MSFLPFQFTCSKEGNRWNQNIPAEVPHVCRRRASCAQTKSSEADYKVATGGSDEAIYRGGGGTAQQTLETFKIQVQQENWKKKF